MDLQELRTLDLKSIPQASKPIRIGFVVIICAVLLGLFYHYDTKPQLQSLKQVEAKEVQLRKTFEDRAEKAANLRLYKEQLVEMRKRFAALRMQLPSQTEIPGLIVDVSQTGLSSGLEIDLFKPGGELSKDFYAEKPIDLTLRGTYNELAQFVSGVAALPRIVTLHNLQIKPSGESELVMNARAKTYRYLGDEDGDLL